MFFMGERTCVAAYWKLFNVFRVTMNFNVSSICAVGHASVWADIKFLSVSDPYTLLFNLRLPGVQKQRQMNIYVVPALSCGSSRVEADQLVFDSSFSVTTNGDSGRSYLVSPVVHSMCKVSWQLLNGT